MDHQDIHVIIRPKNKTNYRGIRRAGTIKFNKWFGEELRETSTGTLWWKGSYLHCYSRQAVSFLKLEILPTEISRLLHFGFTIEILQENKPLFLGEWGRNTSLTGGFTIQINLEKILQERNQQLPHCVVSIFIRQPEVPPLKYEFYQSDQ